MTAYLGRLQAVALLTLLFVSAVARARPNEDLPAWQAPLPAASDDAQEAETEADSDAPSEAPEVLPNPFSSVPPISVEGSLTRTLSSPDHSFCKAEQSAAREDPFLCSLSQLSARQRCPGLSKACSLKPATKEPSSRSDAADSPAWKGIGELGTLTFWLVLAGLLIFLVFALRRILVSSEFAAPVAPKRASPSPVEAAPTARHMAETDVARLLSLAEQSALSARFEDAVSALQAALIHALRMLGKLHVSPAQTNGDYLRALRADESYGAAREVFRSVEAVQFGGAPANAALYRKLFERVQPIVVRVLSVLLLCAFCLAESGCAKSLAVSTDANGRGLGVLTQLLRDQQITVRRRIRALNEIEPDVSEIMVVGEQPSEVWAKLLEFTALGGTLIVTESSDELAKETNVHYQQARYQGPLELPTDFDPVQLALSAVAQHALDLRESDQRDQTFATAGKHPYVAERSYGKGSVLYFGDDEFLSNASLSVGDNAFFAVSLLARNGKVLELVGPWTGGGASSTFSSLFKAGLGALVAQLALLAVLFGWHGGTAFGLRRDPLVVRRRAFRDHVLALGESYRRARATRFALASYGSWLIERLRERLSPQQPIGLIELAGRVAARVEQPEAELVLLLTETRDAQEDLAAARASAADLETLAKLETLTIRAGASK